MENYPVLRAMIRFGQPVSIVSGLSTLVFMAVLLYPLWGTIALGPAVLFGGAVYVVVKSYVEIIRLVSETLAPE